MKKHVQYFGTMRYEIEGIRREILGDIYHILMRSSWWFLLFVAFLLYISTASIFAIFFYLGTLFGDVPLFGVHNNGDFFWFSVHTASTIGYGSMYPISTYGNILVLFESFVGLVELAIVTAVLFAKFSRPKAKVAFAKNAVIFERDNKKYLQIRFANTRGSAIINAHVNLSVLLNQQNPDGTLMRRLITLPLLQPNIPFFGLSFTATHCLSEGVLSDMSIHDIHETMFLLIVSFTGVDEILEQEVREQHFYRPENILENSRYQDMVRPYDWGAHMDLHKLDCTITEK